MKTSPASTRLIKALIPVFVSVFLLHACKAARKPSGNEEINPQVQELNEPASASSPASPDQATPAETNASAPTPAQAAASDKNLTAYKCRNLLIAFTENNPAAADDLTSDVQKKLSALIQGFMNKMYETTFSANNIGAGEIHSEIQGQLKVVMIKFHEIAAMEVKKAGINNVCVDLMVEDFKGKLVKTLSESMLLPGDADLR